MGIARKRVGCGVVMDRAAVQGETAGAATATADVGDADGVAARVSRVAGEELRSDRLPPAVLFFRQQAANL